MADLIYMAKSKWRELLDTIRTKGGTSASMTADQAIAAVEAIHSGGGDPNQNLVALNNNALTSFSDASITQVRPYMFYGNTTLASISIPSVTSIGAYAFYKCAISGVWSFENFLRSMASSVFREMPNLTGIVFKGGVYRFDMSTFERCTNLSTVDIGDWGNNTVLNINQNAFLNTANLNTLVIRGSRVFPLGGAFPSTTGLATGTIYVPSSLVDSYKAATNWSRYANQIVQIEGSIYENAYADGTPIT